jgi:hypothetical protein
MAVTKDDTPSTTLSSFTQHMQANGQAERPTVGRPTEIPGYLGDIIRSQYPAAAPHVSDAISLGSV